MSPVFCGAIPCPKAHALRYKLTLEYDGRPYHGWQKQEGIVPSVQETLERAWAQVNGVPSPFCVAGRTDKGVHARGQVAHVDSLKVWDPWVLIQAMNAHLRKTRISVLNVEEASPTFHARFHANSKIYVYEVVNRRPPLTYQEGTAWHVPRQLDESAMQEAAMHLLGTHDFTSFRASGCQSMSPLKTMDRVQIRRSGDTVEFEFQARSFLYHQVRNMVGGLVEVGIGKWTPAHFKHVFEAKDRRHGGVTAPADGLYLQTIIY